MNTYPLESRALALYVCACIIGLHTGLVDRLGLVYMSSFVVSHNVLFLYLVAGLTALFLGYRTHRDISSFSLRTYAYTLLLTSFLGTLALSLATTPVIASLMFIVHISLTYVLWSLIQVFSENTAPRGEVATHHSMLLMTFLLGYLLGPFLAGYLVTLGSAHTAILLSAWAIIPLFPLVHIITSTTLNPTREVSTHGTFESLVRAPTQIKQLYFVAFLNELFYSVLIMYGLLYVHSNGITDWQYLSLIMPIILVPFLIVPRILGHQLDHVTFAHKESASTYLVTGLTLTAISLVALAAWNSYGLIALTSILIVSRIGASMTETTTVGLIFKLTGKHDIRLHALYGHLRTLSLVAAGFLGWFFGVGTASQAQGLFVTLAVAMFITAYFIRHISFNTHHD